MASVIQPQVRKLANTVVRVGHEDVRVGDCCDAVDHVEEGGQHQQDVHRDQAETLPLPRGRPPGPLSGLTVVDAIVTSCVEMSES